MSEDGESGYTQIIEFPDQSPSFCAGFEAGVVWHSLCNNEHIEEVMISDDNHDLIQTMCGHFGKLAEFTPTDSPVWFYLTVRPRLALVSVNQEPTRSTTDGREKPKSTASLLRLLPSTAAPLGREPPDC